MCGPSGHGGGGTVTTPHLEGRLDDRQSVHDAHDDDEAAQAAQSLGADVNTSISKHTRIVILGRGAGPKKLEKISELQSHGHLIETIDEQSFLEIISQTK